MNLSKYHAKKTPCSHGHTHDSKKEAIRCDVLHGLQASGVIDNLQTQVRIQLLPGYKYSKVSHYTANERPLCYVADFTYNQRDPDGGKTITVIEDVKGVKTPEYTVKRKVLKWMFCKNGDVAFVET